MTIRIFQKGFHFSQDGPGNRLVYHLQGCNLRCPWCANPEGLASTGGQEYSTAQLVEEAKRSRMMFFEGGGVTLTGGEVTVQMEPVLALLAGLHREGIHTCIETNGLSSRLPELFPYLDLLIMDIKHYDPEIHRAVTGRPNHGTVRNIAIALEANLPLALRIPLIGGFNGREEDAEGFAALFRKLELGHRATVELLPYHEYGKPKYKALNMEYTMTEEAKISARQLARFRRILEDAGISVITT